MPASETFFKMLQLTQFCSSDVRGFGETLPCPQLARRLRGGMREEGDDLCGRRWLKEEDEQPQLDHDPMVLLGVGKETNIHV